MAINPLYGYDTGQYGYGQANTPSRQRKYPAWMTDPNARGIGMAESYTPTVPAFTEIPRYYAPTEPPAAQEQMTAPQSAGFASDTRQGGEGGFGAANDQVGNQPAPGYLGDILGGLGLSTGTYGGSAGGMASGSELDGLGGQAQANTEAMSGSGFGDPRGMYRGGMVTANRLHGPNPPGHDDGFAALEIGEGVMTAAAMQHYGPAFLARLNKLQVPKGAFGKK